MPTHDNKPHRNTRKRILLRMRNIRRYEQSKKQTYRRENESTSDETTEIKNEKNATIQKNANMQTYRSTHRLPGRDYAFTM